MPELTRRDLLAAGGAMIVTGPSIAGSASATGHYPDRPDHIEASADVHELEQYAPAFISSPAAREQMLGTFGWKATSDEHDTDAYYYWTKYATQASWFEQWLPFATAPDAHFQDHEPCLVFVDADGAVDRVIVTGFHHLVLEIPGDPETFRTDRTADPTHVVLEIVDPHHHYRHHEGDREGVLAPDLSQAEFGSWLVHREAWYDNGVYERSHHPAIEDPWVLLERDHWWAEDTRDAWAGKLYARWGLRGGDDRDELRYEVDDS